MPKARHAFEMGIDGKKRAADHAGGKRLPRGAIGRA